MLSPREPHLLLNDLSMCVAVKNVHEREIDLVNPT
jgi:hypothetical protein